MKGAPLTLAYRLGVTARIVAAVAGAYAFASLTAIALARTLPMPPADATTLATLLGILGMPAMVVWIFAAKTAARAWVGLVIGCALCAAIAWIAGPAAGGG
jgi:hypothetical protein